MAEAKWGVSKYGLVGSRAASYSVVKSLTQNLKTRIEARNMKSSMVEILPGLYL